MPFFGGGVGGTPDFLTDAFLLAVEAEEDTDRMELVEIVLFATVGASFALSTGDGGGFLLTTEALEAVEGTLERGVLGVETVVLDLVLAVDIVDAVETTRERG